MARTPLSLPFSGRLLRAERERAGLLQEQLAEKCTQGGYPVVRASISSLEIGRVMPSPPLLAALASALGVQVDALLDAAEAGAA
jgi:transcriptional regulator with XRE-family HTH domain